jgi:hypothetical protein
LRGGPRRASSPGRLTRDREEIPSGSRLRISPVGRRHATTLITNQNH